ncbi:hypothetical protein B0A55_12957 [Friedmanniomyces simplex]|uniref:FAD-binding domain-containing protein n=1 Tax=Friedmanniomyces simplex TaxID=329884 RepID=A0A4U0WMA5_9PEZI|nr:hypothetical protein B0A55_12957 [Friedmanniomyces simplex]
MDSIPAADFKVLIIGAGVAGLALAQILRKRGLAFEVFERDDGARNQGWSVGLDKYVMMLSKSKRDPLIDVSRCLPSLRSLLPDELDFLEQASPNFAVGKPDGYAFVHSKTHQSLGALESPLQEPGKADFISAERVLLRRTLSRHLVVQYGKRLASFQRDSDGVAVNFTDGSIVHGTVLVGADGANSRVRSQLLSDFKSTPSQYVILHGNVVLAAEEYAPVLEQANTGIIIGEPGLRAYDVLAEYLADGKARWQWAVAWKSEEGDGLHAWSEEATAQELHRKATKWTEHFPDYFRLAVQKTGAEGMQTPPIKLLETVLPVETLFQGPVTLLGDAAHSMVPFRGTGANTALQDACDLGAALIKAAQAGGDVQQALREYEQVMVPRGRRIVLESQASDEQFDMSGGRLPPRPELDVGVGA